jgi:hypothetical protein
VPPNITQACTSIPVAMKVLLWRTGDSAGILRQLKAFRHKSKSERGQSGLYYHR